ncbi:MAG TPA: phytanoyl-CoA dioxygenase family protein [Actinomycetota bacterium]|jgi:ectoine hydroxylase-related dioxygenase (phytanoyl-CoA dioxygenase family)|nr:phytanoyl-CoA dioxygenase family protein [Actinomycetota bacterium]
MHTVAPERWSARMSARLDQDGYVRLPGALDPALIEELRDAVDATWKRHRTGSASAPLHLLAFLREDRRFVGLLDHRPVIDVVAEALGPNIFMYHAHLDVHPPEYKPSASWMWHQDGGIQNRDLETSPRPRMSVKVAYFLTDVSEPGRGNFVVLPGSHRLDTIDRPPHANDVPGAVPILAEPGDAVVFDRRLWHMRSANRSRVTRKALFLAYTYRWVRPRDDLRLPPASVPDLTPVQRQLAGVDQEDPFPLWMPDRSVLPLRDLLDEDGR